MEDRIGEIDLGTHRILLLVHADQVVEELSHTCYIREDRLFDLAVCGWTEETFIHDAYGWSLGHE